MQKSQKSLVKSIQESTLTVTLAVSCLAVSGSLFAEFVLDKLCIIQRGLWLLLLGAAAFGFFLTRKSIAKRVCQALLVGLCVVSIYHSLVQFKILRDRCTVDIEVSDLAAYRTLILKSEKAKPPCSEEIFNIGGIPIPVFSGITSILLLGLWNRPNFT